MRSRAGWMWRDGGGARHTSDGASPRATARGTRSRKWRSATACIRGCCSGGGGIARRRARARVSSRWWSRRPSRRARRRPGAWRSCWARTCGWWSSPAAAARISALIVPRSASRSHSSPPATGCVGLSRPRSVRAERRCRRQRLRPTTRLSPAAFCRCAFTCLRCQALPRLLLWRLSRPSWRSPRPQWPR